MLVFALKTIMDRNSRVGSADTVGWAFTRQLSLMKASRRDAYTCQVPSLPRNRLKLRAGAITISYTERKTSLLGIFRYAVITM